MNQRGNFRDGGSADGCSRSELLVADDIESSFPVKILRQSQSIPGTEQKTTVGSLKIR
jgi:hypothetical protein